MRPTYDDAVTKATDSLEEEIRKLPDAERDRALDVARWKLDLLAASLAEEAAVEEHMAVDVRAVLFSKFTFSKGDLFNCFRFSEREEDNAVQPEFEYSEFQSYAALGSSADSLQMYRIKQPKDKLLESVFHDYGRISSKLNSSVIANPHYIVYRYDTRLLEKEHLDEFWYDKIFNETSANFTFVTTYYLKEPNVNYNQRMLYRRRLNDLIRKHQIGYKTDNPNRFRFLVYESLDMLSDFVVLWKSSSIRPVLEALNKIYRDDDMSNVLGHTTTVCAVEYDALKNRDELRTLKQNIDPNAHVDSMTVRAVAKNYNALLSFKDRLVRLEKYNTNHPDEKGKYSFVLGNTDCFGSFVGMDDQVICHYLSGLIEEIEKDDGLFTNAIHRLETTVGITVDKNEIPNYIPDKPNPGSDKLKKAGVWLLESFRELFNENREILSETYAPWRHMVLEQCNLLVQMSGSCTYDNICFLILDSVYLFYRWLSKLAAQNLTLFSDTLLQKSQGINYFVNGWIRLTDMVASTGGVSMPLPGYAPLQHHMSSCILEFCQSFFVETANVLQMLDGISCGKKEEELKEKSQDVTCILIPTQCRRLKTIEQFRWDESSTPYDDRSVLVYIELPIETLAFPKKIVTALIHEASHHYGLFLDRRQDRLAYFYIALGITVLERIGLVHENVVDYEALAEIQDDGKALYNNYGGDKGPLWKDTLPLCQKKIHVFLKCKMQQIPEINHLVLELLRHSDGQASLPEIMEDLKILFSEASADLVLILLLGLHENKDRSEIYLRMMLQPADIALLYSGTEVKVSGDLSPKAAALIQRIHCVCKVCGISVSDAVQSLLADNEKGVKDEVCRRFLEDLQVGDDELANQLRRGSKCYSSPLVLNMVNRYLNLCKTRLQEAIGKVDARVEHPVEALKDTFNHVFVGAFFDRHFYDLIHTYREKVLGNITEKGSSRREYNT